MYGGREVTKMTLFGCRAIALFRMVSGVAGRQYNSILI